MGLLQTKVVLAANWLKDAFRAKNERDALRVLFPDQTLTPSDAVILTAPTASENALVVPVIVRTTLPDVKSITIVCTKNPFPLAATFQLHPGMDAEVRTRVKLGESQEVKAIVQAGGNYYVAKRLVKVTAGGCGG